MIALVRHTGIMARHDSCNLDRRRDDHDRSTPVAPPPGLMSCSRIFVGSASTRPTTWPPTSQPSAWGPIATASRVPHGIFRGSTETKLYVAVHVEANEQPSAAEGKLTHPRGLERRSGARSAGSAAASLLPILSKCNNKSSRTVGSWKSWFSVGINRNLYCIFR